MSKVDDLITAIIAKEGGGVVTNHPHDAGGRTQFGISERSNPAAWVDGKVTEEEARAIYLQKYVKGPGFDQVIDPRLQAQLVDFGVTSGPHVAIHYLQEVVGAATDGRLGPATLSRIDAATNTKLVAARIKMICRIVAKTPTQLTFLVGWVSRALEFL